MSASTIGERQVLGWREWVQLPELGLPPLRAKLDTGAKTSTLHAFEIAPFERAGQEWVRFKIHPVQESTRLVWTCEALVIDQRRIADSGGHRQLRYVIQSDITLGDARWPIQLTLAGRESLRYRLLLGRSALAGRYRVDPAMSYCVGKRPRRSELPSG